MQETNISINEIIMYLRKSRSDDPYMTVEEVLARHERQLQDYALSSSDPSFRKNGFSGKLFPGKPLRTVRLCKAS